MVYYILWHGHSLPHASQLMRTYNLDYILSVIFSNDLSKDPADIPPFNLIVDDTKRTVGKYYLEVVRILNYFLCNHHLHQISCLIRPVYYP